ncbi:MAG: hypothetical protein K2O19_00070, partial [Malacoplasma sp.]|nr:hypothetical protein [Malacoplasma sp.]
DLQNELINELDKEIIVKVNTNQSDSIIENGINYIDTSNLEELKKAINEVENKINLQKVKYSSSESSKESLDYYLYLNHVDKVSVENEISKNYFSICEEFIKKLELKEEVLQKLVDNFIVYVDDNCNQMIVHVSEKLEKAQKVIPTDDDSLSNNNFFAQKSIELFENLKTNSNEIFSLFNEKFKNILKDVSLESLKTNVISFEYLLVLINDSIKEINTKVFHLTDLSNRELAKIAELNVNGLDDLKNEIINEANQIFSYLSNSYLELEEISKDVEKNIRDQLKFKLNKLEQVNSYVSNYQESDQKNDFEGFESSSNYVGVRLERLERQYSKIVNLLNPIAEKLSAATNVENLENIESRINSKIDQLISNIESNRSDDESKYSAAVNEILLSNEVHKQNILNLIQSIEEEKLNIISEESKKAVIENGQKLSELEQLIDV